MQCTHQSRNGTCVASCSSLSLSPFESACFWVLLSLANLALLTPLLRQSHFLLHLHPITFFFHSIQFCFFTRLTRLSNTHCPCMLKTGPVPARQIHMSITSSLILVPSRVFRMCGFFSSSTTMFPARTTCWLVLNGVVFSHKALSCSPFAAANIFGDVVALEFDRWEYSFRHDISRSRVDGDSDFHPFCP